MQATASRSGLKLDDEFVTKIMDVRDVLRVFLNYFFSCETCCWVFSLLFVFFFKILYWRCQLFALGSVYSCVFTLTWHQATSVSNTIHGSIIKRNH